MSKLAILGGSPARTTPFASNVIIDDDEKALVMRVLESKQLSRFMGSPSKGIEQQLVMPSEDAMNLETQYFHFLGGVMNRAFEGEFARKFAARYAITVNSATSGLSTALGACGLGPGDEVITTCLSFNATALSIFVFNSIPVFVDVNPETFCLDPKDIERKITENTKAILVVHLLGQTADMDAIIAIAKKHDLVVIEDCAQALGVKYKGQYVGTIGDVGVFSFQELKNMTTGEGGMIVTNNPKYAKKCRMIRNHGESIVDEHSPDEDLVNNIGFNFRMTELTAAVGRAQLKKLDENNRVRNENADYLTQKLKELPGLYPVDQISSEGNICHVYPVIYEAQETGVDRDVVIDALRAEGIPVGTGYLKLMPENPIFTRKIAYGEKGFPFSNGLKQNNVRYDVKDYPVAACLIYEKFIWFYHINRPNTFQDMDDVVNAFHKVFHNLERLKESRSEKRERVYKW